MRRRWIRTPVIVFALIFAAAMAVHAEEPAGQPEPTPIAVVAAFLELSEPQVVATVHLLEGREQVVTPIARQIAQLKQELEELLANPDTRPARIGRVVLEIHNRERAIATAQAEFLAAFENLLDLPQREKLAGVRGAAALQPILPAFGALGLI